MSPLKKRLSSSTAMIALAIVPAAANATNGNFAHGYGVRCKAMAGTGVAFSQDAVAAAINPAGPTGEQPNREFRGFIQYPCARCAGVAYNRRQPTKPWSSHRTVDDAIFIAVGMVPAFLIQ